ncbi:MAG: dienelactone hydrolase family protein, partial [Acidimicrobiia bacterium]
YPGTHHGFADAESPAYDEAAGDRAWASTVDFLTMRLGP